MTFIERRVLCFNNVILLTFYMCNDEMLTSSWTRTPSQHLLLKVVEINLVHACEMISLSALLSDAIRAES